MKNSVVALATPPGISGLAVIRISGKESFSILRKFFYSKSEIEFSKGNRIYYGKIIYKNEIIDTVTASIFVAPNSYTGENIVEISCHGNSLLANKIIDIIIESGARFAEAGEFTRRAFLNGKIDLSQAEAIADLIHSVSNIGITTAAKQLEGKFSQKLKELRQKLLDVSSLLELELDFSEEGLDLVKKTTVRNQIIDSLKYCNSLIDLYTASEISRSGYYVGIAGYPNSGKSTLFNALLNRERAIVSNIPGTTRDYLEESIYKNGNKIIIADTAGIRDTIDTIEIEGIKFVESVIEKSNLVIVLNDSTISLNNSQKLLKSIKDKYPEKDVLLVQNKIDLSQIENISDICISAKNNIGIEELKDLIFKKSYESICGLSDVLINNRHRQLLINAVRHLKLALQSLDNDYGNEIIAYDLRTPTKILGELTGETWNEEVLNNIFSRFCIGK